MNPIFVIVMFTISLAFLVYWMQLRQDRLDLEEYQRTRPRKKITVVKKADWKPGAVAEDKSIEPEEPTHEPLVDDVGELPGVGPKFHQLLKAAGVTSIAVIAESDPDDLLMRLIEVNESEGITKRPPTMYNVERWIEAAKGR